MSEQLSLWEEADDCLDGFENRLRQLRLLNLFWWTKSLREIFADILQRRESVYKQCMLLEGELERGASQEQMKARIAEIKGLVCAIIFALGIASVFCAAITGENEPRRVATSRVSKGRRRDDLFFDNGEAIV